MAMFGGFGGRFDELMEKQNRETDRRLHVNKMNLLGGVADSVKSQETRRELSKKHPLVQYLANCSAKERILFKQALMDFRKYMSDSGATIEARLVGKAIKDLDGGDYRSSLIEPYERFARAIAQDKNPRDYF